MNVLVNNAGVLPKAMLQTEQDIDACKELLRLNCVAVMELSTFFGRRMFQRRSGYILNVASTAAFQPMPFTALYGASKAFVLSLSEAMHIELGDSGVIVTALCPGLTDTGLFQNEPPNAPGWLYRMVSPELTARRAVAAMYRGRLYVIPCFQHWLLAQASRFLTLETVARAMRRIGKIRHKVCFV